MLATAYHTSCTLEVRLNFYSNDMNNTDENILSLNSDATAGYRECKFSEYLDCVEKAKCERMFSSVLFMSLE
jgi:hypothetical protein